MKNVHEYNFAAGEVLLVNKPYRWTSFDVVRKLRRLVGAKIGHAGTLDPLATGLMILATGPMTKRIDEFQEKEKEYTGTFFLGATTPSFDRETAATEPADVSHLTAEEVNTAAASFMGHSEQAPPIYSAIKINGTRAYTHARKGRDIAMRARPVEIKAFEITAIELPLVHFRIVCTKGTYIRSIADDFGKRLSTGAYLYNLCRTRIGEHLLSDAWDIRELVEELRLLHPQKAEAP